SIAKLKETNISTVTDSIKDRINELRDHFIPENVTAEVIVNEGDTAHEEISGLMTNLATAIIIVVAILLIFLDMRAAILVAISIPLTLMSVFGVGLFAGQNINRITLFALILSLGLLVDNATVVIENIVRWYQKLGPEKFARLTPEENLRERMRVVVDAVAEVGPGLFMSTVTTVLAFIPMAFVTGMMGPYMGPIPFFVPAALIMALLISFTINPWMASVVLKPKSADEHARKKLPSWISAPIALFDRIGNGIFNFYRNFLHHLLFNRKERHLTMTIITLVLLASLALPAVKLVKFRMLPKADRKQFFLYLDLPVGTPLEETYRVTKAYERLLLEQSEIRMVQSYIGRPPVLDFNGLFRGVSARRESNQATLRVGLTHPDTRDLKSAELVLN
ncbi:MAG: efflux RND transporter permease subunit, partial [Leptospiraceae bacterium]|nr:efflux RND transporter permease subunit [Leptospiraceae bacterium]